MSIESTGSDRSIFSDMQSVDNTRENTPMNGSDVKATRMKKSTMALIEESMKYDTRSEFFLPTTFLRERRKPSRADSEEDKDTQPVKPKKRKLKSNTTSPRGKASKDKVERKTKRASQVPNNKAASKVPKKSAKQSKAPNGKPVKPSSSQHKLLKKVPRKCVTDQEKGAATAKPGNKKLSTDEQNKLVECMFLQNIDVEFSPRESFFNITLAENSRFLERKITPSTIFTEAEDVARLTPLKSILFPDEEEKYLISSQVQKFDYNPLLEIGQSIESAVLLYFPDAYKPRGQNLVRSLNNAFEESDGLSFERAVRKFNQLVAEIPRDLIIKTLKSNTKIPVSFIHSILHTCYTRAIYPNARKLKNYTSFSNFVYGELMPNFLSKVYKQCGLNPNSIFMDLGSGVGNCVIQASLEFGCRLSFGCEIMESASDMAELQLKELQSRSDLWGINLPEIELSLRSSFVNNERVNDLIPQCDVILINNFIFDAPLNKEVERIVQNLKPGAKIISLKSIRPPGYSINYDDMENVFNRLRVESFVLPENSVSWTYRSVGDYFISTVLDVIDESIFCPPILGRIRKLESVHYTR
ncbi:unnamed protein product [Kluyveromyces dobzhanskii CBS 2104]|uniref:Histone-lysine N-methyltransferase, H3 lysine-79 specific n=1 Tax=Kluyveromyces dobzhanskii CBS 2104 TaxID=1427455 RepID=A0A0A8KZQ3_9SACH|nr:unnamed protein product [Kluyveromyces dobzhanskii CBS 2104]